MPSTPHRSRSFSATFPSAFSEMARVRDGIRAWLTGDLAEEAVQDVVVIASELMGNSIAACPPDTDVSVLLRQGPETIAVEVSNEGCGWVEPEERWDFGDPLRTGGRGLPIVRALADGLEIVQDDASDTTVAKARYRIDKRAT